VVADRIGISPGGYRYALRVAREIRYGHTRFQDIAMSTGAPRRAHRTAAQTRTSRRDRAPAIFAASATPRVPPDWRRASPSAHPARAQRMGRPNTSTPEPSRSSSNTPAAPSSNHWPSAPPATNPSVTASSP